MFEHSHKNVFPYDHGLKKCYDEPVLKFYLFEELLSEIVCLKIFRDELFSVFYREVNLTFSRKYSVFLSTFQNVLFYYQDIKLTLNKT